MDILTDIVGLTGALAPASWNGVPFYMPDSRHTTGRRVQRFFFPGQDATSYQDLGALDGPMRIQGLLVGDRYIHYANQIEAALRTPGPGTLVHPWLGSLQMVLTEPANISFSQRELRVVKFDAIFAPLYPRSPDPGSSLDALLDDITAAYAAAQAWVAQVLGPVGTAIWLVGQVESYAQVLQGYWQVATGAVPTFGAPGNPQLAAACAPAVLSLGLVGTVAAGPGYAAGVAALIAAVPQAIVGASQTMQPSAVGPGDTAAPAVPIDGRITMGLLLAASTAAAAQFGAAAITAGLALAEAALTAIAAAEAATTVAWASAQEAQAALAGLLAAIDAAATQAALAAATAPVQAGSLWRALEDVRRTLIADMTTTIGRLPQVEVVTTLATLSAWTLANILAGDTPDLIFAVYQDLVARNGVKNPSSVPRGTLELLAPASLATLVPGVSAA